ncbi:hypothetical protein [uncultured Roseobacter sp.]|uniref:hypothetical protein n=1 Tax=uncultured Roseobacter sp. TaxID=114847 RepID=UPI002617143E|nr:hypothetical protein [uncultured Roseobacter sp.]
MSDAAPPEITALRSEVHQQLAAGRIGAALDAVRGLADSVLTNPRAVTRVLGSRELDALCEHIARAATTEHAEAEARREGTVILATKLVEAGGHVELIKDFISLNLFEEPATILLTNSFGDSDTRVAAGFAETQGTHVDTALGTDTTTRFEAVKQYLEDKRPETLVVVVNNNDIIGICAALAAPVENVIFVHHGDHHLSLGVTCKDFQHVDLANMAFENCRHDLEVEDNVYWPLVLRKDVGQRTRHFSKSGEWTSCSVGRPEKFMAEEYVYNYATLLPQILKTTAGTHVHIGDVPDRLRKSLEDSFEKTGLSLDRIRFIPYAPSVAQALVDEEVDFFLGSFPIGGGKSTIEAMSAGMPLVMHMNYRHRMFCGADIAYPGALTWSDEKELFGILAQLTSEVLSNHAQRARDWFEKNHSSEALVRAARDPIQSPPPLADHRFNRLFAFLDEERALRDSHVRRAELIAVERDAGANSSKLIKAGTALQEAEEMVSELAVAIAERDAQIMEIEAVHKKLLDRTTSPKGLVKLLARYLKFKLRRKKQL